MPDSNVAASDWVTMLLKEQLQRGERKRVTGAASRPPKTNLSGTNSIYWQQPYSERLRGHERIRAAVRAGAIEAGWSDQGGEDRPLEWIRVRDVDALASVLGVSTNHDQLEKAEQGLAGFIVQFPRVREVLLAWAELRRVRALGPESYASWRDALLLLEWLRSRSSKDQLLRVVSGNLFGDTKRIEQLLPQLDVLTGEGVSTRPRGKWEILQSLGLVKQPMPFLVAGSGTVLMQSGPACAIARPFVGLAPTSIEGFAGTPCWILTIENLTTFHQAAEALEGRADGLVVYTGGMPSPSWIEAFQRLSGALPPETVFYHWGDIDLGGFRIAAHLQETAIPKGMALRPWLMDETRSGHGVEVNTSTHEAMLIAARRAGWHELDDLPALSLEQERVSVRLPNVI